MEQPLIRSMPFKFSGDSTEYFKIWIVNIFLTIITLGIYSAWAKVRTLRYFYGNTWLDNNSFSYLADPVKILKGRIIAVGILIIYSFTWEFFPDAGFWLLVAGVLLFPFIMVMALGFQMNNSAYRSIRFSFKRDFQKAYMLFLTPIIIVLALTWAGYSLLESSDFMSTLEDQDEVVVAADDFLLSIFMLFLMPFLPYLDYLRTRFIIDQTGYGKNEASFNAHAGKFYSIYVIAFFAFMAIATIVSLLMGGIIAIIGIDFENPEALEGDIGWITILFMIVFYGASFIVTGYIRAVRTNMIFNHTRFGQDTFNSQLKSMPVAWIYLSNTIAIICSAGLLIPWAQIRMARYVADNTEFESRSLDEIHATPESKQSAVGEELGDAFDLDIGL